MSGKVMGAVWELALPHPKQLVMLAMADHADHEGNNVFASVGLIAWKIGYSERQVQRIMHECINERLLVQTAPATPRRPAIYRINVSAGKQKEPYKPGRQDVTPEIEQDDPNVTPGVTSETFRGDSQMSPDPYEPSDQPSYSAPDAGASSQGDDPKPQAQRLQSDPDSEPIFTPATDANVRRWGKVLPDGFHGHNPPPLFDPADVHPPPGLRCPVQECGGLLVWDAGAALYDCPLCGKRYEKNGGGYLRPYVAAVMPSVLPVVSTGRTPPDVPPQTLRLSAPCINSPGSRDIEIVVTEENGSGWSGYIPTPDNDVVHDWFPKTKWHKVTPPAAAPEPVNTLQTWLTVLAAEPKTPPLPTAPDGYQWMRTAADTEFAHLTPLSKEKPPLCKRHPWTYPDRPPTSQHFKPCPDCLRLAACARAPTAQFKPGDRVSYRYRHGWGGGSEASVIALVLSLSAQKAWIVLNDTKAGALVAVNTTQSTLSHREERYLLDDAFERYANEWHAQRDSPKPPRQRTPTVESKPPDIASNDSSQRAKAPPKERQSQAWDVFGDEIARVLFHAKDRAGVNAVMGRVAPILHGDKRGGRCIGLIEYECQRQVKTRETLDYLALTLDVTTFDAWRAKTDKMCAKDCAKVLDQWQEWRTAQNGSGKTTKRIHLPSDPPGVYVDVEVDDA